VSVYPTLNESDLVRYERCLRALFQEDEQGRDESPYADWLRDEIFNLRFRLTKDDMDSVMRKLKSEREEKRRVFEKSLQGME